MSAPSGNSFLSNTAITGYGVPEIIQMVALFEDMARKQINNDPGYSNTEIANYLAALVYTGANNYGNSTNTPLPSRIAAVGFNWQSNTAAQQIVNTFNVVCTSGM